MADPVSSDKRLAERMLAGDEQAFEDFFGWHFPRLYRFALKRLGHNHDEAEEVAQATLCRAIDKLKTYRGEAPLFTWLCTFCRHEIGTRYRKLRREPLESDLIEGVKSPCRQREIDASPALGSGAARIAATLQREH